MEAYLRRGWGSSALQKKVSTVSACEVTSVCLISAFQTQRRLSAPINTSSTCLPYHLSKRSRLPGKTHPLLTLNLLFLPPMLICPAVSPLFVYHFIFLFCLQTSQVDLYSQPCTCLFL